MKTPSQTDPVKSQTGTVDVDVYVDVDVMLCHPGQDQVTSEACFVGYQ